MDLKSFQLSQKLKTLSTSQRQSLEAIARGEGQNFHHLVYKGLLSRGLIEKYMQRVDGVVVYRYCVLDCVKGLLSNKE